MRARFRIRKQDGAEVTPESLGAFTRLVKSGEIEETDLIYDSLTGEWAPARSHPVYCMMLDRVYPENDLGLSVAPPEPEPSPEEAARAFIVQMEEERRADPDRPEQLLDLPLLDRGASGLSRDERPAPSVRTTETADSKRPCPRSKPKRRRGPMLLMILGAPLLLATLIESLPSGESSLEEWPSTGPIESLPPEESWLESQSGAARMSHDAVMSNNSVGTLTTSETEARQRTVEAMRAGARVLMSEVRAGPIPAGWLGGRYLSSAGEHEHVRHAWYAYHVFIEQLRAEENRMFATAYVAALDAEGVGGALRSLRLARARSDFVAGRAQREEVYRQIEELSSAALSLHALLVRHAGSISYEPASGSRLSADPVMEAAGSDPEMQLLLERALDRVLQALSLDGRGAIEAERIPDWVMRSIDQAL